MRKNRATVREIEPDPVYNEVIVTRFINKIMVDGKKSLAENIFYSAMEQVKEENW